MQPQSGELPPLLFVAGLVCDVGYGPNMSVEQEVRRFVETIGTN
jgi:hypothetical protein